MRTLATEEDVQDDGANDGEQDHKPDREVHRKTSSPKCQVSRQPVYPETPEQHEQPTEQQQHDRAADQQLSYAFESHNPILCASHPMSKETAEKGHRGPSVMFPFAYLLHTVKVETTGSRDFLEEERKTRAIHSGYIGCSSRSGNH